MSTDLLTRAVSQDGSARILVLNSKNITEKARQIHELTPTTTALLGRALTACSLMSCLLKDKDNTLTLQITGNGPASKVVCVGDYMGNVKGYVADPYVDIPLNSNGKLDVGGAIGREGTLCIIKDMGLKEPYIGMSPLVSGEIAEDITEYFAQSEQTPTVCALGVLVDRDRSVLASGGFIVQLLPGADDSIIDILERNIAPLVSVTAMLSDGCTNEDIIRMVFNGIEYDIFDEIPVEYHCNCSYEKYEKAMLSLGKEELYEMYAENKTQTAKCYFCSAEYNFTPEALKKMLDSLEKQN